MRKSGQTVAAEIRAGQFQMELMNMRKLYQELMEKYVAVKRQVNQLNTCYKCETQLQHPWHDDGTFTEVQGWIWTKGSECGPVNIDETFTEEEIELKRNVKDAIHKFREEKSMRCDICGEDMEGVTGIFDYEKQVGGHIDCMMEYWNKEDDIV